MSTALSYVYTSSANVWLLQDSPKIPRAVRMRVRNATHGLGPATSHLELDIMEVIYHCSETASFRASLPPPARPGR